MTVKDNIPSDALTVYYEAGRHSGEYSYWRRQEKVGDDWEFKWYWSALGNCGVESTVEDAQQAAKNWIKGLKSRDYKGVTNGSSS